MLDGPVQKFVDLHPHRALWLLHQVLLTPLPQIRQRLFLLRDQDPPLREQEGLLYGVERLALVYWIIDEIIGSQM
jgi:hypothetical protein